MPSSPPLTDEEVVTQRSVISARGRRVLMRELVWSPAFRPRADLQHHDAVPSVWTSEAISRAGGTLGSHLHQEPSGSWCEGRMEASRTRRQPKSFSPSWIHGASPPPRPTASARDSGPRPLWSLRSRLWRGVSPPRAPAVLLVLSTE